MLYGYFFSAFINGNNVHTGRPMRSGNNRAKAIGMQGNYPPAI
nr:hypothetical protein [Hydrotalea sp.]